MTPADWMTAYPDIHARIVTKIVSAIKQHHDMQWICIETRVDGKIAFDARATPLAEWVRLLLTHRDKTDTGVGFIEENACSYRLEHEFSLQSVPFGISPSEPFYDHSRCVIDLHERNHENGLHSICVCVDTTDEFGMFLAEKSNISAYRCCYGYLNECRCPNCRQGVVT